MVYGIIRADCCIFAGAVPVLLLVGLVATYTPGHRAAYIGPDASPLCQE
jgi:hypothetical protein